MVKRGKEEIKVLTVGMEVGARRRIYFFFKFQNHFSPSQPPCCFQ